MEKGEFEKLKNNLAYNLFFAEIGRYVAFFSALEFDVIFLIQSLVPGIKKDYLLRLVAGDNFQSLLDKLYNLYQFSILDENLINQFSELYKRLDEVRVQRNRIIHSIWFYDEDSSFYMKIKKRTKNPLVLFEKSSKITANDLITYTKTLMKLIEDVRQLREKTIDYLNEKDKIRP